MDTRDAFESTVEDRELLAEIEGTRVIPKPAEGPDEDLVFEILASRCPRAVSWAVRPSARTTRWKYAGRCTTASPPRSVPLPRA
jgi:hypothetical protein